MNILSQGLVAELTSFFRTVQAKSENKEADMMEDEAEAVSIAYSPSLGEDLEATGVEDHLAEDPAVEPKLDPDPRLLQMVVAEDDFDDEMTLEECVNRARVEPREPARSVSPRSVSPRSVSPGPCSSDGSSSSSTSSSDPGHAPERAPAAPRPKVLVWEDVECPHCRTTCGQFKYAPGPQRREGNDPPTWVMRVKTAEGKWLVKGPSFHRRQVHLVGETEDYPRQLISKHNVLPDVAD